MLNNTNPLVTTFGHEKRWLNWQYEVRDAKSTKVPYTVNGKKASSTDPSTWSTYDEASRSSDKVGIVFRDDGLLLGIDIDHVISDGALREDIQAFVDAADTYTEISPSGTGLHLFIVLTEKLRLEKHKKAPFELYTDGRYFTVTGNEYGTLSKLIRTVTPEEALALLALTGYPWTNNPERKQTNVANKDSSNQALSHTDSAVLEEMFASKNGEQIRLLYQGDTSKYENDDSRADMALCAHLAFWTGKNAAQMERMWLASGLGQRNKTQDRKDYRDRTIAVALEGSEDKIQRKDADILPSLMSDRDDIELFHDEQGDTFVALDIAGHREIWSTKSKNLRRWLANEFYKVQKKAAGSELIKSLLTVMEGRASFEGLKYKLHNRSAWSEDNLWYDLTDEEWRAIRIDKNNWSLIDTPPILFKRFSHSQPQVIPERSGNIQLLLKYVNIKNEGDRLLLLVYLVTCFIPDFPHVILVIFGSQGSAKSTLAKFLRRIIDPSMVEVASMPDNQRELIQTLAHHAFLFFDNVSYISEITSDTLCKAVTGSGFPKRELYSDDEDVIYSFKRSIGINGINLVGNRSDLLERSLLLQLDRIEPANRKQEKELLEDFEKDLPLILGGVLDVLVKTLEKKDQIKIVDLPRMADFAAWGSAVSVALGYTQEDFLDAYKLNIAKQTETVLNESIVATAIMSFMETRDEWRGTPSELLRALNDHCFEDVDVYEKHWPKTSNILTRRLNELTVNLKEIGISYVCVAGTKREIILKKLPIFGKNDGTDDDSGDLLGAVRHD